MAFDVSAESYDRFMGRFSVPLASRFADLAAPAPGQQVLDVGCGPGALLAELASRVGADALAGIDPSVPFIEAARARFPDSDIRAGGAEQLPFDDDSFDACLAQLVVHFMKDPVAGLREMGRVTRPGGTVAACVWDYTGNNPLSLFWNAVQTLDPSVTGEVVRAGARQGHLAELADQAGLTAVTESLISVTVTMASFDAWWAPFQLGVGPAGDHVASLDDTGRTTLRDHCHALVGDGPFDIVASAWAIRATA